MPAKEAVEKGKAAGMKFITAYVYNVRSGARAGVVSRSGAVPRAGNTRAAAKIQVSLAPKRTARNGATSAQENSFRRLALDLGLERAKDLLAQMERAIESVIGPLSPLHRPSRRVKPGRKLRVNQRRK
jgi:hypothetical protein